MYDTVTMKRRKFSPTFDMTEEVYNNSVFSGAQYVEDIDVSIICDSPRKWIEKGKSFEEMFEQLT
jgi:hypothetical protein